MVNFTDKKRTKPDSIDCTPPDFIMPNSKERPLLPLHPNVKDLKVRNIDFYTQVFLIN